MSRRRGRGLHSPACLRRGSRRGGRAQRRSCTRSSCVGGGPFHTVDELPCEVACRRARRRAVCDRCPKPKPTPRPRPRSHPWPTGRHQNGSSRNRSVGGRTKSKVGRGRFKCARVRLRIEGMRIVVRFGIALLALAVVTSASFGCTRIPARVTIGTPQGSREPGCAPIGAANYLDYDNGCCDGSTTYDQQRAVRVCCAPSAIPTSFGSCS